jgi:hypothetical protein
VESAAPYAIAHLGRAEVRVKYRIRIWIYETKSFQNFRLKKTEVPQIRGVFRNIFIVLIRNGHFFAVFFLGRGAASLEHFHESRRSHFDCFKGWVTLSRRVLDGYPTKRDHGEHDFETITPCNFQEVGLSDTNSINAFDIQLVIVSKSDSACRETPKSVEFSFITYGGVLKQSNSFPVRTLA